MATKVPSVAGVELDFRQIVKFIVYTLVVINFFFYIRNDWVIAGHTLWSGSSFLDISRAFATTIDLSAWLILLLLLELETYWLSDDAVSDRTWMIIRAVRVVCIVFVTHTLYAYGWYIYELSSAVPVDNVDNLCQLAGRDLSYAFNLVYTEIDSSNCASLSAAEQFFYIDPPTFFIVQDAEGLVIEKQLAWIDMLEAVIWLLILMSIEIMVRLQDRNVGGGRSIQTLELVKMFLYALLWSFAAYWIYRGHYMFAWDEFVWIAGFVVIGMNMAEWRDEINQKETEANQS